MDPPKVRPAGGAVQTPPLRANRSRAGQNRYGIRQARAVAGETPG